MTDNELKNEKEILGFSGRLLFVLVVVLNIITMYRQNYTPFSKFLNLESISFGAKASPVIWVTTFANVLSIILTGILIMKVLPKSGKRPRYISALLGLPLVYLSTLSIEYFIYNLINNWTAGAGISADIAAVSVTAILCVAAISVFISLSVSEGSGGMLKSIVPLFLRYLLPTILLGVIVYFAKNLTISFLVFPVIGLPIRAGLNLILVLWFFKTASGMVNSGLKIRVPEKSSGKILFANRLLLLFSLVMAAGTAGMSIMVHGPTPHLNAVLTPQITLQDKKVPISRWELRGDKVIASSKWLSLIVGKNPFDFAVKSADNKILLQLYIDRNSSDDYQGVAINKEYRTVKELPFSVAGSLVKSRFQIWSSPLETADDIRNENQEIIVESRIGYRPVAVAFSFYDEDIMKITVEPGPGSYNKTTSIAFYCGKDEGILGLAGHDGKINHHGQDIELITGPVIKNKNEFSIKSLGVWGERASFSIGPGTNDYPIPFVYFARGAGIFLAETKDPRIEAGTRYPNAVRFSGRGGPLTLYLITGSTPEEVFKRYGEITDKKPVPPESVISPWTVFPENINISDKRHQFLIFLKTGKDKADFPLKTFFFKREKPEKSVKHTKTLHQTI